MAFPPACIGNLVEQRAEMLTVIHVRKDRAYRRITRLVMFDNGLSASSICHVVLLCERRMGWIPTGFNGALVVRAGRLWDKATGGM